MSPPRPQSRGPWTWGDHQDNERRIQKEADRRVWHRLARLVGLRGPELSAVVGRFLDDRIAAHLRQQSTALVDQLTNPAAAAALRGALVELLLDDITETVTILTTKEKPHDARAKKTGGSPRGGKPPA